MPCGIHLQHPNKDSNKTTFTLPWGPAIKTLPGTQVQSLTWELRSQGPQHSQEQTNNTKTMTKKSVWFIVMSLFILAIVNFIFSLLFIGIYQCSSVFNEPCLKGFLLCFLSYVYLLFHSLLFLFKLTPTFYIL